MQTDPLPYNRLNIVAAFLLAIELACFIVPIVTFVIEERLRKAEGRLGWEGEAGGLMVALLVPLVLYTLPFCVKALWLALKRGSQPMSGWMVFLGLLPITGITLLFALLA
jgi:hypothetical protein